MNKLDRIPKELKESIFEQLFDRAEIAKFSPEEVQEYEDSLKTYRDLKNSIDTARAEGKMEGKIDTAKLMLSEGEPIDKIVRFTGLSKEDIAKIK